MRTIAIVNEKGGTGKTTTSVNLAAALGEAGKKVLLVDLDGQAASSRWVGVQDDTRFADALWRGTGLEPVMDVMTNVALAPGHGKLDAVAHDLRPTQGGQLRKLLSELDGFDYVLIDCPPSLGNRLIGNALLAATEAIVPVETSILALDGLKILLTTLDDIRQGFGHDIKLTGVVACRFDQRTRLSRLVLEELRRALPGKVFNTAIRENVRMRECPASGQSIMSYAPDSHAAEDYRALAGELIAIHEAEGAAGAAADQPDHLQAAMEADHWQQIAPMLKRSGSRNSNGRRATGDEQSDEAQPEAVAEATEHQETPAAWQQGQADSVQAVDETAAQPTAREGVVELPQDAIAPWGAPETGSEADQPAAQSDQDAQPTETCHDAPSSWATAQTPSQPTDQPHESSPAAELPQDSLAPWGAPDQEGDTEQGDPTSWTAPQPQAGAEDTQADTPSWAAPQPQATAEEPAERETDETAHEPRAVDAPSQDSAGEASTPPVVPTESNREQAQALEDVIRRLKEAEAEEARQQEAAAQAVEHLAALRARQETSEQGEQESQDAGQPQPAEADEHVETADQPDQAEQQPSPEDDGLAWQVDSPFDKPSQDDQPAGDDSGQSYPALREMLDKMGGGSHQEESPRQDNEAKRSGWRWFRGKTEAEK